MTVGMRWGRLLLWMLGLALVLPELASAAAGAAPIEVAGIPLEFILFGLTLLGVALFHNKTLQVAVTGLTVITLYKIVFAGFKEGTGLSGFVYHLEHEWVIIANLFGLLLGFALLARHFEDSEIPKILPRYLPDDWKGAFVLLVIVFVLSSFLDNIAAALIGGAMAHTLFRGKLHIGYIAAIVAASNAGGSGSVVGDTTTTMMWIHGVPPRAVFHAYVAAGLALVVCGIPAAMQQHKHSPILRDAAADAHVDWARVGIVAFILAAAVTANIVMNVEFTELSDSFPFIGAAVWLAILVAAPLRKPEWSLLPGALQGGDLPALAGPRRDHDAGGAAAGGGLADSLRSGLPLRGLRQHSAHRPGVDAGRLRLGDARLRGRLRRLDDLVRFVGGRRDLEHVPRGEVGRRLAQGRLARDRRLCPRFLPPARDPRLDSARGSVALGLLDRLLDRGRQVTL